MLIKDNIDSVGMVNSAGSLALAENRPKQDAFLVKRLREAGAVILGKTNLSEWANFRSTRSTSGWSSRGGQTKNPYILDRNPCGSSSGTGTAIAASLAAIGVGTETDGSIICPAAVSGLVGLKPTVGLVSRQWRDPDFGLAGHGRPNGPKRGSDVAMLLNGLAGVDAADPAGAAASWQDSPGLSDGASAGCDERQAFRCAPSSHGLPSRRGPAMDAAMALMKAQGAVPWSTSKLPTYNDWNDAEFDVLFYEFKDGLNAYLKAAGSSHQSLEALIAWNKANANIAMPFFGQEIFERAQAKGPLTDPAYLKARAQSRRMAGADGLMATLKREKLDAIIAPSMSPAWPTDHVLGDHFVGAGYGMAAVAGTPSITIPVGDSHGLPIGLTFMGRAYTEADLLGFAYALEQVGQRAQSAASTRRRCTAQ